MAAVPLRFFQSSRGRIVNELRQGRATADELASRIGQTKHAVRAQLRGMESDGLVETAGVRAGTTRPFAVYRLTAEVEQLLSRAYIPLLSRLVQVFASRQSAEEFETVMRETGRALAHDLGLAARRARSVGARLAVAANVLNEQLGAVTQVTAEPGGFTLKGAGCPLAALTDKNPGACLVIESLLAEGLGLPVQECCERDERPRCCFRVRAVAE